MPKRPLKREIVDREQRREVLIARHRAILDLVIGGNQAGLPVIGVQHIGPEIEDAEQVRVTGGVSPDKQIQLALFLASEASNHITGKLIHVNDDWRRFERDNMKAELYTLRRVQKI